MAPIIGFVLLTHNKPFQIRRLIDRLNSLFGYPPIVCHHDFSQCDLSIDASSNNVSFVRPHLHTKWGDFSIAESTVRALEQLYLTAKPEWCVVLSGADYPIKGAPQILSDLQKGGYDAHSEFELIDPSAVKNRRQRELWKRYHSRWVRLPRIMRRWTQLEDGRVHLRPVSLLKPFLPFSAHLRCHVGLNWFSLSRRAAEYVIHFHKTQSTLAAHYQHVLFPEESYFQTILANGPFKINQNNWRYIDWSEGTVHPKILRSCDLPTLLASSAHFARKFDLEVDGGILDQLDSIILESTSQAE